MCSFDTVAWVTTTYRGVMPSWTSSPLCPGCGAPWDVLDSEANSGEWIARVISEGYVCPNDGEFHGPAEMAMIVDDLWR